MSDATAANPDAPAAGIEATIVRLPYHPGESPCRRRNEAILSCRTPWIFLLDCDARPETGCVQRLLDAAREEPRAAAASPRIVLADEPGRVQYDGAQAHFLGEACFENAGRLVAEAQPPSRRPGAASTTALLLHRDRAVACGLFDENLMFCREDLDFTLRLRGLGHLIVHVPEAVVVHERGPRPAGDLRDRRLYLQTRNRWRVMLKLFDARTLALTFPLQALYELLNAARAAAGGRSVEHAAALLAVLEGLGPTLRARKDFMARKSVDDRALLGAPPLSWTADALALPGARRVKAALDALCRAWWPAG